MKLPRRYLLGAALASIAVAGSLALDIVGRSARIEPLMLQFTRGTTLAAGEAVKVSAFVGSLIAEPRIQFHVQGHTGDVGDADANLALSQQRADLAAKLLQDAGVDPAQIAAVQGIGGTNPLPELGDESTREHQRRMARVTITAFQRK